MMPNLKNLIISKEMTIKEAMRQIETGSCKTVFLVENNVLIGTVTDGDVRRHLLSGGGINDSVCQIVNYHPKYFTTEEKVDYQDFMIKNILQAVPIVNEQMQLIRVEKLAGKKKETREIPEDIPVIMMAGGLGTRLKPYTEIIPKPLIPIGPKTISEHIFDMFELYGCNTYYMILNYKKGLIEAYFNEANKYTNLHYVEEPFFMGTAGGIQLVKDNCKSDFFLVNCDILVDCDYYALWEKHTKNHNVVTMVLAKKKITIPYGTVSTKHEQVVELVEKPDLTYNINTGLYLCNAKIFEYIENKEKVDMPTLITRCIDAGEKIGQVTIEERDWYDMGQPEELELMKRRLGVSEYCVE